MSLGPSFQRLRVSVDDAPSHSRAILTFGTSLPSLPFLALAAQCVVRVLTPALRQRPHRLLEVVLSKETLLVNHQMNTIATRREKVMLERSGTEIGVNDVTRLLVSFAYPFGKFHGVRDRGGQEDVVNFVRQ